MQGRVPRRALLALLAVVAIAAAVPAAASAAITPSLGLSPTSVSAGATQSLAFNLTFSPSSGDYPSSVTLSLPPGLILNAALNGGACLNSATPAAGCELASGTQSVTIPNEPVSLWLVKAPASADIAGAVLVSGTSPGGLVESTGAISLRTTPDVGLVLSFAGLPGSAGTPLTALGLTLSGVRAPTTCPATPATVGVSATSHAVSTPRTTTAALPVTGCAALPYSPMLAATVDRDTNDSGAMFTATLTGSATGSATKTFAVGVPSSIAPNVNNALKCLSGTKCTIGVASASSPFLPSSALSNGTVTLGGSILVPRLTITFPAPYPITLTGSINITTEALTFDNIPDLPLTSLALKVGGPSETQLFTTTCQPSNFSVKVTPWNGAATRTLTTPITYGGSCPTSPTNPNPTPTSRAGKPSVSRASLRGLVKHAANLTFTVKEGKRAKPLKRIALGLPKGLRFARKKASLAKGIVVRGANGKKAKFKFGVSHGVLTITLSSAATQAKVTLGRSALGVSSSLGKSVKSELRRKKVAALRFGLKLTDSGKTTTRLTLKLKPKS